MARDVFDHFKLCGELRNAIYDALQVTGAWDYHSVEGGDLGGLRVQARRVVLPKLLTLSRRFGAEYQAQADKSDEPSLTVSDTKDVNIFAPESNPDERRFRKVIPPSALRSVNLRLNVLASGGTGYGMAFHWKWMTVLADVMPRLRSISMRIHIITGNNSMENREKQMNMIKSWSHFALVKQVEVYKVELFGSNSFSFDDEPSGPLVLRWCAEKEFERPGNAA